MYYYYTLTPAVRIARAPIISSYIRFGYTRTPEVPLLRPIAHNILSSLYIRVPTNIYYTYTYYM